jgi:hypothetical protein
MDGASPLARFGSSSLPHLSRAITIVILIQTIFLLSIFAEIFVTTGGAFGTRTLTYLIYQRVLESQNVGLGSAGGVYAIILANIVALFLMRIVGKNLDAEEGQTWHAPFHTTQGLNTAARLGDRAADLLPDPLDDPDLFKTEAEAIANPPVIPVLRLDAGKLRRGAGAVELHAVPVELGHHRGGLDPSGHPHRGAGGLVHGLRAVEADQGHPAVDAVDQDAARGRRALPDLPAVHSTGRAGQPRWR